MPKTMDKAAENKGEKRTTITFNISPENKKAIKIYAAEHETTISALITGWIEKECKKAEK